MRKQLFTAFMLAAFSAVTSLSLDAQEAMDLIKENPGRAAGVYHNYEPKLNGETPAPKNFSPFYISNYSRHGSRYHSSDYYFGKSLTTLKKCETKKLLTPQGLRLKEEIERIDVAHRGMEGMLTQKGGNEQQGVAERMYRHYLEVFKQKDKRVINCMSSVYPRALMSMINFTDELKGLSPEVKFHFETGDVYMDTIAHDIYYSSAHDSKSRTEDSLRTATFNPDRIMRLLFNDPAKAAEEMDGHGVQYFIRSIYLAGAIIQDLDSEPLLDIFSLFTTEELYEQWWLFNIKTYANCCNSIEYGSRQSNSAKNLLENVTESAERAIKKGSNTAADLRFGHDTGLLPLVCMIGLDGFDKVMSIMDLKDSWYTFQRIPMCSNLQMIFYRNKKDEILVKFLYNEEETGIPSLKSYSGPYYRWTDLKVYFDNLCKTAEAENAALPKKAPKAA